MTRYIVKKLLLMIPLLFLISIILFTLISMLPGDAVMSMISDSGDIDYIEH